MVKLLKRNYKVEIFYIYNDLEQGKMMKKVLVGMSLLLVIITMNGCASKYMAKKYSTGAVGCVSDDIEIKNEKLDMFGYTTWIATCNSKSYICNHHDNEGTNCKELSK